MKSDRIHLTSSPVEPPVSVSFLYKTAAEKYLLSPKPIISKHTKPLSFSQIISAIVLLLSSQASLATTWIICPQGFCDFVTIQAGIDYATAGDTVAINGGNYQEQLVINKDLTLTGVDPAIAIIDAVGGGSGLTISSGVTVTVNYLSFINGLADEGGGVHNSGNLTLNDVWVYDNFAWQQGGGIWSDGANLNINSAKIYQNSVSNNQTSGGGGIYLDAELSFSSHAAEIRDSSIYDNSACKGAGINNSSSALVIFRSEITNNMAGQPHLGAGDPCDNVILVHGGGLLITGSSETLTQIKKSTISRNFATHFGGGIASGMGHTVTITNSTLSGNEAYNGSAINTFSNPGPQSNFVLNNTTITEHISTSLVGSAIRSDGGVFTFRNSIVADQTQGDNCLGSNNIISQGFNLESASDCGFTESGDLQFSDPQLLSLANNGGLTQTHALSVGSLAIDAGAPFFCLADMDGDGVLDAFIGRDQRGQRRSFMSCDIGAFEL